MICGRSRCAAPLAFGLSDQSRDGYADAGNGQIVCVLCLYQIHAGCTNKVSIRTQIGESEDIPYIF